VRDFATAVGAIVIGIWVVVIVLLCVVKLCSLITRRTPQRLTEEHVLVAITGAVPFSEQEGDGFIFITPEQAAQLEKLYMDYGYAELLQEMKRKGEIA
jgi:hypothetical protein